MAALLLNQIIRARRVYVIGNVAAPTRASSTRKPGFIGNGSTIMKYIILSAALVVGGCSAAPPPQIVAGPSHITYRAINLSGSDRARASITFQSGTHSTDKAEVTMPWETTFTISAGTSLYIAAQNVNNQGGIQVFILKNGREVATGEAVGENAIARAAAAS
jgi:hypothetical protein